MAKKIVLIGKWLQAPRIAALARTLATDFPEAEIIDFTEDASGPEPDYDSEQSAMRHEARMADLMAADVGVYVAPGGCDSWCEVGVLLGRGVPVLELRNPLDTVGLHRHGVTTVPEGLLIDALDFHLLDDFGE